MKKVILSLLIASSVMGVHAQKENVNKAKNKALMETPDFAGARELIAPALVEPSTKNVANTWYVAGLIGYKEKEKMDRDNILNPAGIDQNAKGAAVMESYAYFVKADSLDQLPDAKGRVKPKFRKEIKRMMKEYYAYDLISYGAALFDERKYNEALNVFNSFLAIPDMPLSEGEIPKDSTYYMIAYFAGIAASQGGNSEEAIRHFTNLKDKDYETLTVYQFLHEEYKQREDTVNFINVLKEGSEKFPNEPWFLQNLINFYIYSNQPEIALSYLNTAVERDPNMAQYRFVEGGLYESLKDNEKAEVAYLKAIELDPTLASAHEALGRLHYNAAVAILDAADELITDRKAYAAEQSRAKAEFEAALPFYSKAHELSPDEMGYKVMLRALYYRLGMDAEYEAIDKEINE